MTDFKRDGSHLSFCPPVEKWDDWVEYDSEAWPRRVEKHYQLVPTICFNCESACGLLAYVDKETGQVAKFEGNPKHPASRGRLCAKGPATINQIHDPDRVLYPMKLVGPRDVSDSPCNVEHDVELFDIERAPAPERGVGLPALLQLELVHLHLPEL